MKANKITSNRTPLQYDYYDLPFCKKKNSKSKAENIGERLSGDSLTTSPYEVCALCEFVFLSMFSIALFLSILVAYETRRNLCGVVPTSSHETPHVSFQADD